MIQDIHAPNGHSVHLICETLDLPRSSYHHAAKPCARQLFAPVGAWGQTVKISPPLTLPQAAREDGIAVLSQAVDDAVAELK